jgi:hypothetical protein
MTIRNTKDMVGRPNEGRYNTEDGREERTHTRGAVVVKQEWRRLYYKMTHPHGLLRVPPCLIGFQQVDQIG